MIETPFSFSPPYVIPDVFCARIQRTHSGVEHLLNAIYHCLWFPGYFGFNWDALYDCLRDFNWIKEREIVLVHEGLPTIPDNDLKLYLEVLRDSVVDWKPDESHALKVVFPEGDRKIISKILASD
ncbi:MAG: barstar family protein [Rhodospirillaceae bacterium]|nr:barstar family protein [Rhodospirillales bacterium]